MTDLNLSIELLHSAFLLVLGSGLFTLAEILVEAA